MVLRGGLKARPVGGSSSSSFSYSTRRYIPEVVTIVTPQCTNPCENRAQYVCLSSLEESSRQITGSWAGWTCQARVRSRAAAAAAG